MLLSHTNHVREVHPPWKRFYSFCFLERKGIIQSFIAFERALLLQLLEITTEMLAAHKRGWFGIACTHCNCWIKMICLKQQIFRRSFDSLCSNSQFNAKVCNFLLYISTVKYSHKIVTVQILKWKKVIKFVNYFIFLLQINVYLSYWTFLIAPRNYLNFYERWFYHINSSNPRHKLLPAFLNCSFIRLLLSSIHCQMNPQSQ